MPNGRATSKSAVTSPTPNPPTGSRAAMPWKHVAAIYLPLIIISAAFALALGQPDFLIRFMVCFALTGLGAVYGVGAYDLWLRIHRG